jgi:hypothetical protein
VVIPGAHQKEYDCLRDVQSLLPRAFKGIFFLLTGSQRPTSYFDIRNKEVRFQPPEDDTSAGADLARFLPKLDSFLSEYTFTKKTPII